MEKLGEALSSRVNTAASESVPGFACDHRDE